MNYDWIVLKAKKKLQQYGNTNYIITNELKEEIVKDYPNHLRKFLKIPMSGNSYTDLKEKYQVGACATKSEFAKKLIEVNPYLAMNSVTDFYEEKFLRIKMNNYFLLFNERNEILIKGNIPISNYEYISHFKVIEILDEREINIDFYKSDFHFDINNKKLEITIICDKKNLDFLRNRNNIIIKYEVFGLKKIDLTDILDYIHTGIDYMAKGNKKYAFYAFYSSFDSLINILYDSFFDYLVEHYESSKNLAFEIKDELIAESNEYYCKNICKEKKCEEFCEFNEVILESVEEVINSEVFNYLNTIDTYLKEEIRTFSNKLIKLELKYKLIFERINTYNEYDELLMHLDCLNRYTNYRNKIAHGVSVDLNAINLKDMLYSLLTVTFAFARGFSNEEGIWEFLFSE